MRSGLRGQKGVIESGDASAVDKQMMDSCQVAVSQSFVAALHKLSVATDSPSTRTALGQVAECNSRFLEEHGGRFESMLDTLSALPVPRVDTSKIRHWFGTIKEFPEIDILMKIVSEGAPVVVAGNGDLKAAVAYGNHTSVNHFSLEILEKNRDDVVMRRAFVFPREAVRKIEGVRVSPMTVAVSASKVRICHHRDGGLMRIQIRQRSRNVK